MELPSNTGHGGENLQCHSGEGESRAKTDVKTSRSRRVRLIQRGTYMIIIYMWLWCLSAFIFMYMCSLLNNYTNIVHHSIYCIIFIFVRVSNMYDLNIYFMSLNNIIR